MGTIFTEASDTTHANHPRLDKDSTFNGTTILLPPGPLHCSIQQTLGRVPSDEMSRA